jgi:hypothetical protein
LAHGPEENSGRAGRTAGRGIVVIAMSPILTDEQRPVGGAWPAAQKRRFALKGKGEVGGGDPQASGLRGAPPGAPDADRQTQQDNARCNIA